ncbi:MAG TPA: histidine--tRNA ligase [bacterium]|uniref:Histidine--tRNA ligase n=1 Tax=candidate division TA06 bacterium ADurb.Bin417 TaxID=1852828 RepID=A0A1V5MEL4_UNCT6|nr:MAG: Histidine--tRNA ligase [candidate division TA06 bacterium ADurb.Bin417]HNQ35304.1 histidine--tRNA ligase [bacterium]HNS48537.1 histidine--tRNA ligase [bacterium]
MEKRYQAVRGTYDLLPAAARKLAAFLKLVTGRLEQAGFQELETPVLEEARLFNRSVGPDSDLVTKEMYTFQDRKGRLLALRPEGTAPLVRAYLEHDFTYHAPQARFYYLGPMFRYDRPQEGRYRQFLQLGGELFGVAGVQAESETLDLLNRVFNLAGLPEFRFEVNSLGCRACQEEYGRRLSEFIEPRAGGLCPDCLRRSKQNPLRVLDCKVDACRKILGQAPVVGGFLCPACREHHRLFLECLRLLEVPFLENPRLVRGLDYYTRSVFEVTLAGGGNALAAGGRYDNLVEELGGPATPAFGFAIGLERLMSVLPEPPAGRAGLRILYLEAAHLPEALRLVRRFREALPVEWPVTVAPEARSLKSQLRQAARDGCRMVAVLGPEELARGEILWRDLESGRQVSLPPETMIERLKNDAQP